MFSLLPGGGLGIDGASSIAFGLGAMVVIDTPEINPEPVVVSGGGGGGTYTMPVYTVRDNAYSHQKDDDFLFIFSTIIPQVIE